MFKRAGAFLGAGLAGAWWFRESGPVLAGEPAKEEARRPGSVYTFGSNEFGQLGVPGSAQSSATPQRVEGALRGRDLVQVAVGDDHALALDSRGAVFSWGRSQYQALGFESDAVVDAPVRIQALAGVRVTQVAASDTNSYALDEEGRLWSWGRKKGLGRSRGHGAASQGSWLPEPIPLLRDVLQVAAGHGFALALSAGRLYSWGENSRGSLGLGGKDDREVPTPLPALPAGSDALAQLSAGGQFALALAASGRLWFFGGSDYGQSGSMARRYEREPAPVPGLPDPAEDPVVQVAAGRAHCAALTASGALFCWGLGAEGQLGSGSRQVHNPTPSSPVVSAFGGARVVRVACGGAHTAAVTEDGRLFCWGRGREGQLGQADALTSVAAAALLPQEVAWFRQRGLRVRDVSLGGSFTCVLAEEDAASQQ